MYQRITFFDFCDAFWRADRAEQFSYEAKRALFEHLEQLEDDTGEKIELDVVGLCCEYEELTVEEVISNYGLDDSDCYDDEAYFNLARDYLNDNTTVIWSNGKRFLYQQF